MDALTDLRLAFRKLVRTPWLSLSAVLALTLGIGLTTMTFSIVYGALYRGLPFPESERLVHLERTNLAEGFESLEVPIHDFVDWRAQQRVFEDLAAFYEGTVNLSGRERPERFDGAFISPGAFPMLRVRPLLGRTLQEADAAPGAPLAVLISHHVWRDHFDGDPAVVGRPVRANAELGEVVGVMPPDFLFPVRQEVWLPLRLDPLATPRGEGTTLEVFGRLREGVEMERAAAEMSGIARRIALEHPATNRGIDVVAKPYLREVMGDENYLLGGIMLGAVFLVLLIACANVANLLLARTVVRTREIGIRAALGAGRRRIVLQFMAEALAIATVGAVLGMGITWAGTRWFQGIMTRVGAPFWIDIRVDGASLLFVLAATVAAAAFAGALPAWRAGRADVAGILKDQSRGSSSFRMGRVSRALVVLEVALSLGLLVPAGLLVKSIVRLNTVEYAFAREEVFTARLGLMEAAYPDAAARVRFHDALLERLRAVPGADAVALATQLPGFFSPRTFFEMEGVSYAREQDRPAAARIAVTPGYFDAFRAPVSRGRDLAPQDREGSLPVAVVNESFARRHFAGDAIGRRIRLPDPAAAEEEAGRWVTIVGVAPDLHPDGPENERPEAIYVPLAQSGDRFVSIAARGGGAPLAMTDAIRDAVAASDADLPLYWIDTLAGRMEREYWQWGTFGALFTMFGVAALILAAIGLYAVMAFSVTNRTREVGVRMALGADARRVVRLILRQGMGQLALGILLGLGLAAGLGQALGQFLFQVQPRDPGVFALVLLLLGGIGLGANVIPAWRASRVPPVEALRHD